MIEVGLNMDDKWYNLRVNLTVILVLVIFIVNNGAQFLLYSNQEVLALEFFGSTAPQYLANIRWVIAASLLTCGGCALTPGWEECFGRVLRGKKGRAIIERLRWL